MSALEKNRAGRSREAPRRGGGRNSRMGWGRGRGGRREEVKRYGGDDLNPDF
jgi:hypothetical protein